MSHDIFFQYHEQGGDQQLPTEAILSKFAPFLQNPEPNSVEIWFDENNSSTLFISTGADAVSSFMVNHPCSDPRLDEMMFSAGLLGHVVSFEPGFERAIIFRDSTTAHLPAELLESMGMPICLATIEEYRARYDKLS